MRSLELRIPPAVLVVAAAILMWLVAWALPALRLLVPRHVMIAIAIAIALLGALIIVAGLIQFRHARTTVNPMNPGSASSLVMKGIYTFSRNPMYLGFAMILLAWAVYLSHPVSLLVLPLFIWYMNRFQIIPEERALEALFGSEFNLYRERVRRWL
jgi:protein-S-isoprenylcysteine O-methyltransferase Ste14